jgi:hypothetical protein
VPGVNPVIEPLTHSSCEAKPNQVPPSGEGDAATVVGPHINVGEVISQTSGEVPGHLVQSVTLNVFVPGCNPVKDPFDTVCPKQIIKLKQDRIANNFFIMFLYLL